MYNYGVGKKITGPGLCNQLTFGIFDDKFFKINERMYGRSPMFLAGVKCRLFVVDQKGTSVEEYPLYLHNSKFYALMGMSNRHVYAKIIYPENVKKLDMSRFL